VRGIAYKERATLPLLVLDSADEVQGISRMMKFTFLAQQRLDLETEYFFEAYDYGPFCNKICQHLETLQDAGFVSQRSRERDGKKHYLYSLTEEGEDLVDRMVDRFDFTDSDVTTVEGILDEWNTQNLTKLLNFVYSEYPRYAENSVI
jgi:uncharacterized protein YwgA